MVTLKQMQQTAHHYLSHYTAMKEALESPAVESRGLSARPAVRTGGSHYSDPTANQALYQLACGARAETQRRWVWAIESARAMLEREEPEKARLMRCLYSLDRPLRSLSKLQQRLEVMYDIGISEPTLYKWRQDILLTVASAAIQAGVLSPYPAAEERKPGSR